MPSNYVLVWREPPATRLRTYTSADDQPLASPLSRIYPHPSTIINDADALQSWLNSTPSTQVVAIREDLARTELGWEPTSPSDEETTQDDTPQSTQ